jgi:penicillin-binding protein 2
MNTIERPDDRRPPITPQLAWRVALLGGLALVLFGIVFFRLWYLQVLSGNQYVQEANSNRVRDIALAAPRGAIVDRNGETLVQNRVTEAVEIIPGELPAPGPQRDLLYRRLGRVLQMSPRHIGKMVDTQYANLRYANVTLKTDAGTDVLNYLAERQQLFPAVTEDQIYLRQYPLTDVGAQLVGTVGQINPIELKDPRFRGVTQGTVVGQAGIEWSYDRYLRGRDGAKRVEIDSLGNFKSELAMTPPVPGRELRLSVDLGLQKAGQQALLSGISLAQHNGHAANAGAFVAMDPTNGQVLALGSEPTFDPNAFAKPITQAKYDAIAKAPGAPLYDRAIQGLYPTGSTMKPITSVAALQSGTITPDTVLQDNGCIGIGAANQQFCNSGSVAHGSLAMRQALQVSSDVFYYQLGEFMNPLPGEPLQTWQRKLGLGNPTGIDLPNELGGLIPDRAWRAQIDQKEFDCERRKHVATCGISDGRPWTVGDNVNLAVGQGDLQATPLQMAVAYSAIVNGGDVLRPHLGLEVDDSVGRLIQKIDPPPSRHVDINPVYRQTIMDGLLAATSQPGGTSYDVFQHFPRPVYGKTGTAQRGVQDDQSWFVCYSPGPRPIVVAVTIEKGGFGAEAAAPAARQILSQWYFGKRGALIAGQSRTR